MERPTLQTTAEGWAAKRPTARPLLPPAAWEETVTLTNPAAAVETVTTVVSAALREPSAGEKGLPEPLRQQINGA